MRKPKDRLISVNSLYDRIEDILYDIEGDGNYANGMRASLNTVKSLLHDVQNDADDCRDRLIGNEEFVLIGAEIIAFATFEDADERKNERRAYIALFKASKLYYHMTDDEVEAEAGEYFDAQMSDYDKKNGRLQ